MMHLKDILRVTTCHPNPTVVLLGDCSINRDVMCSTSMSKNNNLPKCVLFYRKSEGSIILHIFAFLFFYEISPKF